MLFSYITILYVIIAAVSAIGIALVVLFDYNSVLEGVKSTNPSLYGRMQESQSKWKAICTVIVSVLSVFWPMVMIYMISKNKIKQKAKEI